MTTDNFLEMCEASHVDLSKLKVLFYVFERTDPETYMFVGSFDEIARGTSVSYSAVVKTMNSAEKSGVLSSCGKTRWHIEYKIFQADSEMPVMEIRNFCKKDSGRP